MKRVSDSKFEALEKASRELLMRHEQVQSLVVRMENFQWHFASWTAEKQELERDKLQLHLRVVSIERGLDHKSSQIDQKTHKLKDLVRTITLQDERLRTRSKFIEDKEAELALYEQNMRNELEGSTKSNKRLQDEQAAIKLSQKELEEQSQKQARKEQELFSNEQRLIQMERSLQEEHQKSNVDQQRRIDLSNQLQNRHEEVTRQRREVEERQQKIDEYEARLRLWEEQLEQVTNHLLQGNGGESSRVSVLSSLESRQHQHQDDLDSLQGIEDSFRR